MRTTNGLPLNDGRMTDVRSLNSLFLPDRYPSPDAWERRKKEIAARILAAAGLDPALEKTPLNARIFDEVRMPGYTVAKAVFESLPGVFVTGNLYRPPAGAGLVPAVLNPHGHWKQGRFNRTADGDIPARCAVMARMGMIALSHDMAGFGDSLQMGHAQPWDRHTAFHGLGLLGVQLWNCVRALDFLLGLPGVDPDRVACTGASGGGTQTFLLAAVDDRVRAAAPVNMVSSVMQGGCCCENAPLLRLGCGNLEIAACAAPRPMLMVSCTGDWTSGTPAVEYPWVRHVYALYGAQDRLEHWHQDAGHNYNRASRQRVYEWLSGLWGLPLVREEDVAAPDEAALRIGAMQGGPLDLDRYLAIRNANRKPDGPGAAAARLRLMLGRESTAGFAARWGRKRREDGLVLRDGMLAAADGIRSRNPLLMAAPGDGAGAGTVLLVHPSGREAFAADEDLRRDADRLCAAGYAAVMPDLYGTGPAYAAARPDPEPERPQFDECYNPTADVRRIRDIAALADLLRAKAVLGYGSFSPLAALSSALPEDGAPATGMDREALEREIPDVPLLGLCGDTAADALRRAGLPVRSRQEVIWELCGDAPR